MNISQAASRAGLPAKTIRYYEEIGLIMPDRTANGYRDYSDDDVSFLNFIRTARELGFSIEDCRQLMALYLDKDRASQDVRRIAVDHLVEIDRKISSLKAMRGTLNNLVSACSGDRRPNCPILEGIAKGQNQ